MHDWNVQNLEMRDNYVANNISVNGMVDGEWTVENLNNSVCQLSTRLSRYKRARQGRKSRRGDRRVREGIE